MDQNVVLDFLYVLGEPEAVEEGKVTGAILVGHFKYRVFCKHLPYQNSFAREH